MRAGAGVLCSRYGYHNAITYADMPEIHEKMPLPLDI